MTDECDDADNPTEDEEVATADDTGAELAVEDGVGLGDESEPPPPHAESAAAKLHAIKKPNVCFI